MKNGWTGGQYSVFRLTLGLYLFIHFLQLVSWGAEMFSNQGMLPEASVSPLIHLFPNVLAVLDSVWFVKGLLLLGASLGLLFAVGLYDRITAILLWYILACLLGRNPLILNPGIPFVGWMLLAHSFLQPAPYGSAAAMGRTDPGNGWHMNQSIFAGAWILLSVAYSYSGIMKWNSPSWIDGTAIHHVLMNPLTRPGFVRDFLLQFPDASLRVATWFVLGLELLFAPLALIRILRKWIWLAMLLMHASILFLLDFTDLSLGMIFFHFFTFNPSWVKGISASVPDIIFYDGNCGLCHRFVRFVLAEDTSGNLFRFAPLASGAFEKSIRESQKVKLPDSVVLFTGKSEVLIRSAAILYVLKRMGGFWRAIATFAFILPTRLLDGLYNLVARVRLQLFKKPAEACPVVPAELRSRFLSPS